METRWKCKQCGSEDIDDALSIKETRFRTKIIGVEHRCRQCGNRYVFDLDKDEDEEVRHHLRHFEVIE